MAVTTLAPTLARRGADLYCENVALADIAARFGTPTYLYSRRAIVAAYRAWSQPLAGRASLICYAMKANSNLAVLQLLAREGSGFDIVSGGELARVLAAGGDPKKTVFSGVGKKEIEIAQALEAGILSFNAESAFEVNVIERVAQAHGARAPLSLRVNPDIDAQTHPYISTGLKDNKFGIAYGEAYDVYRRAADSPYLSVVGIDCHIGSQITAVTPYVDAAERVLDLVDALAGDDIRLHHLDLGGGLGIRYREETPPAVGELIAALLARIDARGHGNKTILFEPGRSIVGPAGALLTSVMLTKHSESKNFAVVDAAMNDLMRPALYGAWMNVLPVHQRDGTPIPLDIVGPVCESGDWLARERTLALQAGDLVAIADSGAYGMSMASNYNSRPRAAEVMIDGDQAYEIRRRETVTELFAGESLLP